ncbi:MAG: hypothetical protein Q4C91_21445 [Eubacteriales bacterium]|nr:hypothetical protein [Eubacteriales bacterium]
MKKLVMGLLCMIMALTVPTSALAGELSIETNVDVNVKYTEEEVQHSQTLDSEEPIILPDETKVTVQAGSDADSNIRVVIVPVEEEDAEALSYVEDMVRAYGEQPYAFYIMFYRDGKETAPSAPVNVSVTAPEGYEESALYSFTGDGGEPLMVSDGAEDGTWTFTVSESRYFAAVLPKGEKPTVTPEPTTAPTVAPTTTPEPTTVPTGTPAPTGTPEPTEIPDSTPTPTTALGSNGSNSGTGTGGAGTGGTGTDGATQGTAVKTGDETSTVFWLLVLIGAAACTVSVIYHRKRVS